MAKECDFRPECRQVLQDLKEDVVAIRKAVLGNGGKGIKDQVAVNTSQLKIIGAIALAALGGAITAILRMTA